MMTFSSFASFIESYVLPLRKEHPGWRRLDGETTGGNRNVAARFVHQNTTCKVHADTHFDPLLVAYEAARGGADPFEQELTRASGSLCLVLVPSLRVKTAVPSRKYLYMYA